MKTQHSYIHLAFDKNNIVVYVKVTAYSFKAPHTVANKALIELKHNNFTLISYPFVLKRRLTKPFKKLIDFKHSDELNTREFLREYIKDNNL